MTVDGELHPALAPGGDAVLLESGRRTVLRYGGLRSWDARGRAIPTRLELRANEVRLVIDERDAQYPLIVDPTWTQQAELTAPDGTAGDGFGYSIAVSGNTAVIGAPDRTIGANEFQGAVYVFVQSGTSWVEQQELTAFDGASGDLFGYSVSVSADTVVVGAPFKQLGLNIIQGSVYVFVRTGTTWGGQQEILAADSEPFDFFGTCVSVSADTVVIGAAGKFSDQGAAYVFVRTVGATVPWAQQQELTAFDGSGGDEFGASVSVSGDTAVVGAQGKNGDQGVAYVFVRTGGTLTGSWTAQEEVLALDQAAYDNFGRSVSVSGSTLLVGAPAKTVGSNLGQGAAYVFTQSGVTWTQQQELTASDGASNDEFGSSVALNGTTAVIGAPEKAIGSESLQGAAYVFVQSGSAHGRYSRN